MTGWGKAMTYLGWESSDDPVRMLAYLTDGTEAWQYRKRATRRKLRLFGYGLWLQYFPPGKPHPSRQDLDWIENDGTYHPEWNMTALTPAEWARTALQDYTEIGINPTTLYTPQQVKANQRLVSRKVAAYFLRSIFGNPEEDVSVNWEWLTETVLGIARETYEKLSDAFELDSERLLILSDALMDAGCPGEVGCHECAYGRRANALCSLCRGKKAVTHPIVKSLRSPGPHFRGLFALDLILGKT